MQTRLLSFAICFLGSAAIAASGCGPSSATLEDRDDVQNAQDDKGDASSKDGEGEPGSEEPGDTGPADKDAAGPEGAGGSANPSDGSTPSPGDSGEQKPQAPAPLATGIRLDKIVLYQGVAIPLMSGGQAVQQRSAPIVSGRDAMLRVHVAPTQGFTSRQLAVEIEFEGANAPKTQRQLKLVRAASADGDLGSTFNFELPGAHVTQDLSISVAIREAAGEGPDGSSDAKWPSSGKARLGTEDANGDFKIVIVPIRYQGDRSGRLPDTSAEQIEQFRKRFHATYPAPNTEIVVRSEPITFSEAFSRNGTGWSKVLSQTCSVRQQDRPARNVYYYGLIAPASSFSAYCGSGCVTGLGNVVKEPSDDYGRCSIGLGFGDDRSLNTALHEVGHSLGRSHAPCGNPDGIDRGYPYTGASTGVWGYDMSTKQLREASKFKDFMSYCDPQWISDYTYKALFDRISFVNGMKSVFSAPGAPKRFRIALIGEGNTVEWGDTIELPTAPTGDEHELPVLDDEGHSAGTLKGYFYEYSHLPGGTMLVPVPNAPEMRAIRMPGQYGGQVLRF